LHRFAIVAPHFASMSDTNNLPRQAQVLRTKKQRRAGNTWGDENASPKIQALQKGAANRAGLGLCASKSSNSLTRQNSARGQRTAQNDLKRPATHRVGPSDITNIVPTLSLKRSNVTNNSVHLRKLDTPDQALCMPPHEQIQCERWTHGSMSKRLPRPVIANILEMAGLKHEMPKCEYAISNLKTDLRRERDIMPRRGYITGQRTLNGRMRAILVDWIAQVLDRFRLSRRTFFLTVSLIDRYLSKVQVDKRQLQLVGSTAFLVAAKVEEIHPPDVVTLVSLCGGAYTREDLLRTECEMLHILDFCVSGPTAEHFLPHFIVEQGCLGADPVQHDGLASLWHVMMVGEGDKKRNGLAWYLAELALLDIHMIRYSPSQLSAACLYLSNHLLKIPNVWDEKLTHISGWAAPMLDQCASDLDKLRTASHRDSLQQINYRHAEVVDMVKDVVYQPTGHVLAVQPYTSSAPDVPW